MNAKVEDHYTKQRQPLHSIVPLNAPLSLNIEPATFCNLKCNFCIYSCPKDKIAKDEHFFKFMSDDTFERIVQQISQFKQPIKSISFIGTGEPLMHKKLPEMISRIKKQNLAERILIVTNGTLLTEETSKKLIDAGVDVIKISVNGLNADDYKKNCGTKIQFDTFLKNIKYLYNHRGKCQIYIKTLTSVLDGRDEKDFYNIYGDFCDKICVERTMPYFSEIDYNHLVDKEEPSSRYSSVHRKVKVCAAPFMRIGIRVDGKVTLCGCRVGVSTEKMDIRRKSLYDIWNGAEHREVLLNVLKEKFEGITEGCAECTTRNDFTFEEDNLDNYIDEVYKNVQNEMIIHDGE